jgi:hypothetical protein
MYVNEVAVASNGITSILNFVIIGQVERRHTDNTAIL